MNFLERLVLGSRIKSWAKSITPDKAAEIVHGFVDDGGQMNGWLKALIAAAIGGAAGNIGIAVGDPAALNNPKAVGIAALMGALTAVAHLLVKSPLPPKE